MPRYEARRSALRLTSRSFGARGPATAFQEVTSIGPFRQRPDALWPSAYPIASKSVFATAHLPVTYWAAPAKLKQPVMTADPSIALKSMSTIVAPDLTVGQAAFPVMCLVALKRWMWRGWRAGILSTLVHNELPVPAREELGSQPEGSL